MKYSDDMRFGQFCENVRENLFEVFTKILQKKYFFFKVFFENVHNMSNSARQLENIAVFPNFLVLFSRTFSQERKEAGDFRDNENVWTIFAKNCENLIQQNLVSNLAIMKKDIFVPCVLFEIGILSGSGPGFRTLLIKICLRVQGLKKCTKISYLA